MIVAVLAAVGLLAGCSASAEVVTSDAQDQPVPPAEAEDAGAPDTVTFEFTREPPGLVKSLTVAIPEDLKIAAASDATGLLVDRVTLTPYEVSGVKFCAVNLDIEWTEGALDFANRPAATQADADAEIEKWMNDFLTRFDVTTKEEWVQLFERAVNDAAAFEVFNNNMLGAELEHPYVSNTLNSLREDGLAFEPRLFLDRMQELITVDAMEPVEKAAQATEEENVARRGLGYRSTARPLNELSDSAPESGLYLAADFTSGVSVVRCAVHPMDDDASERFIFRTQEEGSGKDFAEFEYTVLNDGSITVISADVADYQRDFNEDWIAK